MWMHLRHTNIVQWIDFFMTADTGLMVMDAALGGYPEYPRPRFRVGQVQCGMPSQCSHALRGQTDLRDSFGAFRHAT